MNEVYTAQALAFDRIMPANAVREFGDDPKHTFRIPCGAEILADGSVKFSVFAPEAKTVEIRSAEITLSLAKKDGIFTGIADLGHGFISLNILIDGTEVLYQMLPIGFGYSRPVNYVDVPKPGEDFFEIKDVPHGSVCEKFFYSQVTGRYERCFVYLPPQYFKSEERYPVLYLQHGHGENEACWIYQGKLNFIFDNLLAEGKAKPAVVVMNNGMVQVKKENGERYVNSGCFEAYLLNDVIPFIENEFRVYTDRLNRAMAGLSMGSMQTSVITFCNQDKFAWAGLFSGFMRDLMNENTGHLEYADTYNQNMKLFFRAMGDKDAFMNTFLEDDEICAEKGLYCIRRIYQGSHEWNVWRKCIRDFLQLIFQEGD